MNEILRGKAVSIVRNVTNFFLDSDGYDTRERNKLINRVMGGPKPDPSMSPKSSSALMQSIPRQISNQVSKTYGGDDMDVFNEVSGALVYNIEPSLYTQLKQPDNKIKQYYAFVDDQYETLKTVAIVDTTAENCVAFEYLKFGDKNRAVWSQYDCLREVKVKKTGRFSEIFHLIQRYKNLHRPRDFVFRRVMKKLDNDEGYVVAYGDVESCEGMTVDKKHVRVNSRMLLHVKQFPKSSYTSVERSLVTLYLQADLNSALPMSTKFESTIMGTIGIMREKFDRDHVIDADQRKARMQHCRDTLARTTPNSREKMDIENGISYFRGYHKIKDSISQMNGKFELTDFDAQVFAKAKFNGEGKVWIEVDALVRAPAEEVLAFFLEVEANLFNDTDIPKRRVVKDVAKLEVLDQGLFTTIIETNGNIIGGGMKRSKKSFSRIVWGEINTRDLRERSGGRSGVSRGGIERERSRLSGAHGKPLNSYLVTAHPAIVKDRDCDDDDDDGEDNDFEFTPETAFPTAEDPDEFDADDEQPYLVFERAARVLHNPFSRANRRGSLFVDVKAKPKSRKVLPTSRRTFTGKSDVPNSSRRAGREASVRRSFGKSVQSPSDSSIKSMKNRVTGMRRQSFGKSVSSSKHMDSAIMSHLSGYKSQSGRISSYSGREFTKRNRLWKLVNKNRERSMASYAQESATTIIATSRDDCVVSSIFPLSDTFKIRDFRRLLHHTTNFRLVAKAQSIFQMRHRKFADYDEKDGQIIAHLLMGKVKRLGWRPSDVKELIQYAFENYVSLKEIEKIYPFFKPMIECIILGGDGNSLKTLLKAVLHTDQKSKRDGFSLICLSRGDGVKLGTSFESFLTTSANEEGAVYDWIQFYPALVEFSEKYSFFVPMVKHIAHEKLSRVTWDKIIFAGSASAGSMMDFGTDVYTILYYFGENLDNFAYFMCGFLLLTFVIQILVVIMAHSNSSRLLLKEVRASAVNDRFLVEQRAPTASRIWTRFLLTEPPLFTSLITTAAVYRQLSPLILYFLFFFSHSRGLGSVNLIPAETCRQ